MKSSKEINKVPDRPTGKVSKKGGVQAATNHKSEAVNPQSAGASFFEDVWAVVRLIPKGRVTSYGAIANYLGTRLSARMVGWAMNASHTAPQPVPAQRVVNRNGMLSGRHHFPSPDAMEKMLKEDGVLIENDTVTDFDKRFWDPAVELAL
jgi:methylated-DNA-protein-cysteine methyltransferase related protein